MSIATCGGMEFAKKLRALMRARRYSQAQLGLALGLSQNVIGKWSRGESDPRLREAARLAEKLGVDVNYLADDTLDAPAQGPAEVAAMKLVRSLGLDEDEVIRRLAGRAGVGTLAGAGRRARDFTFVDPKPADYARDDVPEERPAPRRSGSPRRRRKA